MKNFVKGSAKAIYAGVAAGLATAIANASNGFTTVEYLGIAAAVVAGFGGTYFVENTGPKAPVPETNTNPGPTGQPPLF